MGLSLGDLVRGAAHVGAAVVTGGASIPYSLGTIAAPGMMTTGINPQATNLPVRYFPDPMGPQPIGEGTVLAPVEAAPAGTGTVLQQPTNGGVPPTVVAPTVRAVHSAPPGYVIVNCPRIGGKVAMLKPVAQKWGLWKPRRRPPIKVSDWRALMKAESTVKKLKAVTKKAGIVQRARGRKA